MNTYQNSMNNVEIFFYRRHLMIVITDQDLSRSYLEEMRDYQFLELFLSLLLKIQI